MGKLKDKEPFLDGEWLSPVELEVAHMGQGAVAKW